MKLEHRKYIAAHIVWFVIANLLYFSNIKEVAHQCTEMPGWLPLWVPFTLGIKELFPYAIQTYSSDVGAMLRGEGEWLCHQNFLFDEVGYGYFVLIPVFIVVGGYFLYKWAFNKSNSVTTTE